jgi:aspartyl-tRNA(Asn)/glutamyl-tRNA(Gln) amidotransferase subunit C
MPLTLPDVHAIAHLARLELDAEESHALLQQLNEFFAIVGRMSTVDTAGIEPLYTPLSAVRDVRLRLREDVVTEKDRREENLRNAPAVDAGLFLVPKVIE